MTHTNKTPGAGEHSRGFQNKSRLDYNTPPSIEKIESALAAIPSDDRETWLRVGMAIKAELGEGGFDMWDVWSQSSDAYRERDAMAVWKSFRAGKVTVGTLFRLAQTQGWRWAGYDEPPTPAQLAEREQARREREASWAREQADTDARRERRAVEAAKAWGAATPCESHPYLEQKGVKPHGLRTGDWIKRRQEDGKWIKSIIPGALLIPLADEHGRIWNIQGVWAEPPTGLDTGKQFMPGAQKAGLLHIIGEPTPTILIAEGFATGATVHEETRNQTYVAFDCGNLKAVALTVRKLNPNAKIILCADNDRHTPGNPGITKAREAALAVNGFISIPVFPDGAEGTDFNDLRRLRAKGGHHGR